jgi:hypothetical protein
MNYKAAKQHFQRFRDNLALRSVFLLFLLFAGMGCIEGEEGLGSCRSPCAGKVCANDEGLAPIGRAAATQNPGSDRAKGTGHGARTGGTV